MGRIVENKTQDTYLGFVIQRDGFKQSVNANIKAHVDRAWSHAADIKSIVNHPYTKQFGWLKAIVVLVQATPARYG